LLTFDVEQNGRRSWERLTGGVADNPQGKKWRSVNLADVSDCSGFHVHRRCAGFRVRVLLETTAGQGTSLGHRFEQSVLVAEQAVDGRWLQACRDRDRTGGDRVAALARQQVGGGLDDALPGLLAVCGCGVGFDGGSAVPAA